MRRIYYFKNDDRKGENRCHIKTAFDTIAAESQRQMNETYSAFVRSRLPKFEKPKADRIENLSASVVIDQTRLGENADTITAKYLHKSLED